jgi:hypothetical protein
LQIPVAKLEFQTIQDHHNLIQDHLSECLQIYGFWSKDVQKSGFTQGPPFFVNNEVRMVDTERGIITCQPRCSHEGCDMFTWQKKVNYKRCQIRHYKGDNQFAIIVPIGGLFCH